MKTVRTRFQPTAPIEVDDARAFELAHQGLLFAGSHAELAQLHEDAGLPVPAAEPPAAAPAKPTAAAAAAGTDKKEGAAS